MPFVFSHAEYCDMHFMRGFCDGNARAAVDSYQRRFLNEEFRSWGVFSRIHQIMRETFLSSKCCSAVWKGGVTIN